MEQTCIIYIKNGVCYPEIMNAKIEDIRMDFFKRECQNFKEDITNHY